MQSLKRIKKVQNWLKEKQLNALIVDAVVDLFYLTGQHLSLGRLLIEPERAALFVDGRYFESVKRAVELEVFLVKDYGKASAFAERLAPCCGRIGFDGDRTSYLGYQKLVEVAGAGAELVPLPSPVKELRAVKEAGEIELLAKAALLAAEGYHYGCSLLKEGVEEREVAAEMEIFWKKKGADGLSFPLIIAFGENSASPHHRAGTRKLARGDLVLFDIGVILANYHSDMTRCLFFGSVPPEVEKIYSCVERAQARALEELRPGVSMHTVDSAARSLIVEEGYGKLFPHGLGHGVGLEIHEYPVLRGEAPFGERLLEEGMVITVEPGIYLPGLGGVRIEDTVVITSTGYRNLTTPSKAKVRL